MTAKQCFLLADVVLLPADKQDTPESCGRDKGITSSLRSPLRFLASVVFPLRGRRASSVVDVNRWASGWARSVRAKHRREAPNLLFHTMNCV